MSTGGVDSRMLLGLAGRENELTVWRAGERLRPANYVSDV